ncbi:SCO family protein [Sphingomonas sp. MMS24-JH45]
MKGKLVLVNFIFTGCGTTCPTQTAELAKFDRRCPRCCGTRWRSCRSASIRRTTAPPCCGATAPPSASTASTGDC